MRACVQLLGSAKSSVIQFSCTKKSDKMRIFLMTNYPKFGVSLAIVVSAAREKQCERLQWSEYSSVVAASGQQLTLFGDIPQSGF